MKSINHHLLITWTVIIVFFFVVILLVSLLFKPYQLEKRYNYDYFGENAPIPTKLNPIIEKKKNTLINRAAEKNIHVVITQAVRSISKQNALYAQGRTAKGNIVTNTKGGESYHNYGLAIDYALLDAKGNIIWDVNYDGNGNGKSDWFEVADIGKKLGFDWGGDWLGFKDYPHLQMTFDLTIDMLKRGYRVKDKKVMSAE